jgi:hypothetical protein
VALVVMALWAAVAEVKALVVMVNGLAEVLA